MIVDKNIPSIFQNAEAKKTSCEFDKAMEMTGFGKYNLAMTVLSSFIGLSLIMETIGLSYIIPASQCDLGLTLTQKGWVAAIPFVGLMLSSHTWGYLADTRGRRKMLIVSMLSGSTCSILSSFSPNLIVFSIMRLVSSTLVAASNSTIFAYYGEFTPKKYSASMISILSSTLVFSTAVATLIAWGVLSLDIEFPIPFLNIYFKPWRLLIIIFAFPFVISAFCLKQAPESPKFLMTINQEEKALDILRSMYSINTGKNPSTFPVNSLVLHEDGCKISNDCEETSLIKSLIRQTFPLFKPPLLKNIIIFFMINYGLFICANSFYMWLPDILDRFFIGMETIDAENKGFCELLSVRSDINQMIISQNRSDVLICNDKLNSQSFPLMILFSCVLGFFNVMIAYALRFFQKKTILLSVFGVASIAAFFIHWIYNPVLSWIFIVIFNAGGILLGVINAFIVEIFPTQYRSMAVSLSMMFGRIGSISGTNIIGQLIESYCPATFFTYSLILLMCFVNVIFLPWSKKEEITKM